MSTLESVYSFVRMTDLAKRFTVRHALAMRRRDIDTTEDIAQVGALILLYGGKFLAGVNGALGLGFQSLKMIIRAFFSVDAGRRWAWPLCAVIWTFRRPRSDPESRRSFDVDARSPERPRLGQSGRSARAARTAGRYRSRHSPA